VPNIALLTAFLPGQHEKGPRSLLVSKANRYCTEHIVTPQSNCISNSIIATDWSTMAYKLHPTHASYHSNCHLTTEASISNTSATDIFSIHNSVDELQHILLNHPTKKNSARQCLLTSEAFLYTTRPSIIFFSQELSSLTTPNSPGISYAFFCVQRK
jgi:hypothetical protein